MLVLWLFPSANSRFSLLGSQDRIRTCVMRCVFLSGLLPCYTPVLITDTCYQPTYFATTQPDYGCQSLLTVTPTPKVSALIVKLGQLFIIRAGLEPDTVQDGLDNLTTRRPPITGDLQSWGLGYHPSLRPSNYFVVWTGIEPRGTQGFNLLLYLLSYHTIIKSLLPPV